MHSFFSTSEPEYVYKRYAYKKKMYEFSSGSVQLITILAKLTNQTQTKSLANKGL